MEKLYDENKLYRHKLVEIKSPAGESCFITEKLATVIEEIENFDVRPDDTWVIGYPKTGTNWTQEMVWVMANNLDFQKAKKGHIHKRVPVLELSYLLEDTTGLPWENDSINYTKNMESPRFIKTHLPWFLLPKQIRVGEVQPKLIYLSRDPKDVSVSQFNFYTNLSVYDGTYEALTYAFLDDKGLFCPFWNHINAFKKRRHLPNLLCLTYEEMKLDLVAAIQKVSNFINISLTNDEILALKHHLSYESMSKNRAVSTREVNGKVVPFLGKGIIGNYKTWMTTEMVGLFQQWIKRNEISETEIIEFDPTDM